MLAVRVLFEQVETEGELNLMALAKAIRQGDVPRDFLWGWAEAVVARRAAGNTLTGWGLERTNGKAPALVGAGHLCLGEAAGTQEVEDRYS